MKRVTREQKLSVACPTCGASVGWPCFVARGSGYRASCHLARRSAFLEQQDVRDIQEHIAFLKRSGVAYLDALAIVVFIARNPDVCPCESDLEDPGPHHISCPYNDPEYDDGGLP